MGRRSRESPHVEAWSYARGLRAMLEQTLNREQRRELDELLVAWRTATMKTPAGERFLDEPSSGGPPHDVPAAGTLNEISYCRKCGAAYNDPRPCPGKREEASNHRGVIVIHVLREGLTMCGRELSSFANFERWVSPDEPSNMKTEAARALRGERFCAAHNV